MGWQTRWKRAEERAGILMEDQAMQRRAESGGIDTRPERERAARQWGKQQRALRRVQRAEARTLGSFLGLTMKACGPCFLSLAAGLALATLGESLTALPLEDIRFVGAMQRGRCGCRAAGRW